MRASSDSDDPGYSNWVKHGRVLNVRLNGVEIGQVVTADEEKRLLIRCVTDEHGAVRLNAEGTEIQRETLYGDVAICPSNTYP